MSFQIRPLHELLVRPVLPDALSRLPELGMNLMWCWNHPVRAVFRRLDPATWKQSNRNPVVMLGRVPQAALVRAAGDPRFLALYRKACETLDAYLAAQPSPSALASSTLSSSMLVAYFSMEYGLLDCLPIYSGGLGVLSGDHLKASSDILLPLVGIGLAYQNGYFQQRLDAGGWQEERTPVNDFYSLPMTPVSGAGGRELIVSVNLTGTEVFLKVWRIDVGRVKLYLLDSNIPQNARADHREITNQLYGGDDHKRIHQEIVLGIGGLRALKALDLQPTLYHMNEGHSAFLAVERIRVLMAEQGLNFEEALTAARTNNVFTTHTSVPAGIDRFDAGLVREHFESYCRDAGIPFDALLALGRPQWAHENEAFSMAILAMQTSSFRNAVSRIHRRVSQEMWEGLWPNLPVWEVPISSVTNGVHLTSWINGDLAALYDQYLRPDWREGHSDAELWKQTSDIPAAELWEAHRRRKRRLVAFVRERAVASALARNAPAAEVERARELLDPEAMTIGFARRFATYKRATLVFRDLERLKKILCHAKMPVQIVIAGKAHPKDIPGKTLIREIVQFSRDPELAGRVVFVEDYGMEVAGEMVKGVDLWLNTPRRGEEASGTSGMKAGINGVLNLSVLDGWFDEAADFSGGWAIGAREAYSPDRDDAHAASIYSLLENEIAPMYYNGREQGVPKQWMGRVHQCLRYISEHFNCLRMVEEYRTELYEPADRAYKLMSRDYFTPAREAVHWNREMLERWPGVHFLDASIGTPAPAETLEGGNFAGNETVLLDAAKTQGNEGRGVPAGTTVPLRARLDLAGLSPRDVRVEALIGRIGPGGELEETEILTLQPLTGSALVGDGTLEHGSEVMFGADYAPVVTGRLGYSVRVSPNHFDDPINRPCNAPIKWI